MISSAKLTALTLLAAAALGAAMMTGGCTTTSTTDTDTDGGHTSSSGTVDGSKTDGSSGDGGQVNYCPQNTNQQVTLGSEMCQTCLEQNCCTELKTCYDITVQTSDGGPLQKDCNDYTSCIDTCSQKPANEIDQCNKDCDDVAGQGVQQAYEAIQKCGDDKCKAHCSGDMTMDGGTDGG